MHAPGGVRVGTALLRASVREGASSKSGPPSAQQPCKRVLRVHWLAALLIVIKLLTEKVVVVVILWNDCAPEASEGWVEGGLSSSTPQAALNHRPFITVANARKADLEAHVVIVIVLLLVLLGILLGSRRLELFVHL